MKKFIRIPIYIIAIFSLFMLFCSEVKAYSCSYGYITRDGEWVKDIDIDIQGWGQYNLSQWVGVAVVPGGIVKSPDPKYDFIGQEVVTNEYTCGLGIKVKGNFVYTYNLELFATQEIYDSLYNNPDIPDLKCPPTLKVYHQFVAENVFQSVGSWIENAWNDLWGTGAAKNPEHYYRFVVFRDDLTFQAEGDHTGFDSLSGFWEATFGSGQTQTINSYEVCEQSSFDSTTGKCKRTHSAIESRGCGTYDDYMYGMTVMLEKIPSCDDNPYWQRLYIQVRDMCQRYMSTGAYIGESNRTDATKKCMTACSMIRDDVRTMCLKPGEGSGTAVCNSIGKKVIAWIFRIIRIVRYVIPAILILLGIIDFIKAIASDSDDDFKKAGTRFAKRLIAAALVFIIPLILQFILGLFSIPGLDPNNPFCIL